MSKLQKIAEWFLDEGHGFLDDLLFEAVSVSRRLSHYEYDDQIVSGMDAKFHVDFLSPIATDEDDNFTLEKVTVEFNIERHGPIHLRYEIFPFKEDIEPIIERTTLLDWMDCCHMEGPSYDDLDAIRWILTDRLMTLADGKEITNLGILNTSYAKQLKLIEEIRERWFSRHSAPSANEEKS